MEAEGQALQGSFACASDRVRRLQEENVLPQRKGAGTQSLSIRARQLRMGCKGFSYKRDHEREGGGGPKRKCSCEGRKEDPGG